MIAAAAASHSLTTTIILFVAFVLGVFAWRYVSIRISSPIWSLVVGLVVWFVVTLVVAVLASATNCSLHGGCPY